MEMNKCYDGHGTEAVKVCWFSLRWKRLYFGSNEKIISEHIFQVKYRLPNLYNK